LFTEAQEIYEDLNKRLPSKDPKPVSSGFDEGEHNAFIGTMANTVHAGYK